MHRRTLIAGAAIASLIRGVTMSDTASAQPKSDPENTLYLDLKQGRVVIEMFPDIAPKHVERIKTLAREGFYDNTPFHRVIEGFMAQGGDPTGTGHRRFEPAQSAGRVHHQAAFPARHLRDGAHLGPEQCATASSSSCSRRRRIWMGSTRSGARWCRAWNSSTSSSAAAAAAARCRTPTASFTCGSRPT